MIISWNRRSLGGLETPRESRQNRSSQIRSRAAHADRFLFSPRLLFASLWLSSISRPLRYPTEFWPFSASSVWSLAAFMTTTRNQNFYKVEKMRNKRFDHSTNFVFQCRISRKSIFNISTSMKNKNKTKSLCISFFLVNYHDSKRRCWASPL